MKKIILPTDFSEGAEKACEYAINLFGESPVTFVLVNSYVIPTSTSEMLISVNDVLGQSSLENLLRQRNRLTTKFPHIADKLEYLSFNGYLETSLNRLADKGGADLVVMGTSGASGFKRFFIGSNASKVLQEVNCPILTIPFNASSEKPQDIALALDGKYIPTNEVLAPLTEILHLCHAELKPVHINLPEVPAPSMSWIEEERALLGFEVENVNSDSVTEGLQVFNRENNIDLLAMIHHKRSFLQQLFKRANSAEMAKLSSIPLLVLHDGI